MYCWIRLRVCSNFVSVTTFFSLFQGFMIWISTSFPFFILSGDVRRSTAGCVRMSIGDLWENLPLSLLQVLRMVAGRICWYFVVIVFIKFWDFFSVNIHKLQKVRRLFLSQDYLDWSSFYQFGTLQVLLAPVIHFLGQVNKLRMQKRGFVLFLLKVKEQI